METIEPLLDREIIGQCMLCDETLMLHCEFTDPESIKDPFIKRVFYAIRDIYYDEGKVGMRSLFYALPVETRKTDLQICVELML